MSQLLNQKEVSEILNCCTKSVARMVRDKELLAPIILRGMKRWDADELREWLRQQRADQRL